MPHSICASPHFVEQLRVLLVTKASTSADRTSSSPIRPGAQRQASTSRSRAGQLQRDRLAHVVTDAGIVVHRLDGTVSVGIGAARRLARLPVTRPTTSCTCMAHCPRYSFDSPPGPTERHHLAHALAIAAAIDSRQIARPPPGSTTATIVVSSTMAESLPARIGQRAVVVPHGIDPARVEAALAAPDRAGADGPATDVTVVTVASHRDAKNYPVLLTPCGSASEAGTPIRLVTIGDRPTSPPTSNSPACSDLPMSPRSNRRPEDVLAESLAPLLRWPALRGPAESWSPKRSPSNSRSSPQRWPRAELVNTAVGRVVPPARPQALERRFAELAMTPDLLGRQ